MTPGDGAPRDAVPQAPGGLPRTGGTAGRPQTSGVRARGPALASGESEAGPPADAEARRRAVEDLDRCFLVEASAGSGKTTLLVERVLAWVRSGRARLPEIVAITFTEKAAAELRLRVRDGLEAARAPSETPAWRAIEQALADLELAPIRTIHGFCADLLRARPVEAGVDPGFAVADALEAGLVFDEAWTRWLERAGAAAPPALAETLALGVSLDALRALAEALRAERDLLDRLPAPEPEDLPALAQDLRTRLLALAATVPPGEPDALGRALREAVAWLQETAALPEADQARACLWGLPLPPSNWGSRARWGTEALARARQALEALRRDLAGARQRHLHNLAADLARWLTGAVQAYEAALRRRGLLDFHDLLRVTRDLLRDHPEVRRDFQRRFRTVLVDECQDVDPLQLEIAFFLAEDPEGPPADRWDRVRLGPGRLFLVGDPKQSIYRFRRADIETYERARELVATQGEVLPLRVSFRAGRHLLAALNHLFEPQMQPPPDGHYQPAYAPLEPAPGAPAGEPPLVLVSAPEAPPPDGAAARRQAEARAVAALLAHAIPGGAWQVRDPATGALRPARYGDVVCLFRALTAAPEYEEALRAAGVPYRTVGGRQYGERSEVGWALAALRAIEDPYDPVALVATLRSPFFGVPDDALLALAGPQAPRTYLAPLPPGAHPALARAWAVLQDGHARRGHEPPAAVVEALYASTEVLATYGLDPHGEQRVANLLRLVDVARSLEARGRPTLRALVHWLEAQTQGGAEETESPVADEGDDVVRLMTVHAAKGLEFPVVVLADPAWERGRHHPRILVDRQGGTLAVSLGPADGGTVATATLEALREREARREAAEELRLLYVAATRARDHLVLPALFAEPRGFARFWAPWLGPDGPVRQVTVPLAPDPAPLPAAPLPVFEPREAWEAARQAILDRGRGSLLRPPHPGAPLGPGHGPAAMRRARRGRLEALVRAALARATPGDPASAEPAVAHAAEALGSRPGDRERARPLVAAALVSPPYRRAAATRARREVPVLVLQDGELLRETVDLVLVEPAGLLLVAVTLDPDDPTARARLRAAHQALAAAGHGVAGALLLIPEPAGARLLPDPVR